MIFSDVKTSVLNIKLYHRGESKSTVFPSSWRKSVRFFFRFIYCREDYIKKYVYKKDVAGIRFSD